MNPEFKESVRRNARCKRQRKPETEPVHRVRQDTLDDIRGDQDDQQAAENEEFKRGQRQTKTGICRTNSAPVRNSTIGYIGEMGRWQFRHFPRNRNQLNTGMLSYGRMGFWHRGQRDAGETTERPSGMREMHTFRKLPITMPNKKKEERNHRFDSDIALQMAQCTAHGAVSDA